MHATPPLPLTRDLVLVGGGHTHALVLRKWGMDPLPGVRLTLIDPGPTTAYSGMLPGHVAGHYARDDLDIDLVKLARFAGARLVLGRADGIDLMRREVMVEGRAPVGYDVASLDIGVTSDMPDLVGFATHAVPAKPLGPFAAHWHAFLDAGAPGDAAVIGAGIAGAELAMAMAHRLSATERRVHLVERGLALPGMDGAARRRIMTALREAGVRLWEKAEITRVTGDGLTLGDGQEIEAAFIAGTAGAKPQSWLSRSGLALENGYVSVNARLQSSDPAVFAAGDCAHLSHAPRPKAGVYAVRAAPVLHANLRAATGTDAFRRYEPQSDYLKLVSLGRKAAFGERSGLSVSGPWVWRWKDRIDRKFMDRFRDLPVMDQPKLPWPRARGLRDAMGPKPMCGGCGAKVGRSTLHRALAHLHPPQRADVRPLSGDDAALIEVGGAWQVLTTDHLRAFVEDPAMMTRIAAIHALGDIWSMGAEPQAATVSLVLPRLSEDLSARTLDEILQTAEDVLRAEGADIVGGHSSIGDELTIGFSITGLCTGAPITLGGGQRGDALIMTKGLGSGTILAAEMQMQAPGRVVAAALERMARSEAEAARILSGAHAMTDVTGFGLAGHLSNMASASGGGAELWLHAVPHLDGAEELAAQGVRSTLYDQNRLVAPDLPETPGIELLFDPQTAGGLLAAVDPADVTRLIETLRAAGYSEAAQVGWLTEGDGQIDVVE
ncbi:segregation protein B [Roseivivax halodurans JCM 10272]|uniref:Segregation protein B n=1 Tax=Roseivivax halodurans JCM 10272 TaxID=1449350 RepID=X7EDG8_9RHOB|nr:selenide, water dikinase SelD [Roseivivax halodurans]ETX13246.1 segregation protein B [Roseivivax halodurans JCM 10272]